MSPPSDRVWKHTQQLQTYTYFFFMFKTLRFVYCGWIVLTLSTLSVSFLSLLSHRTELVFSVTRELLNVPPSSLSPPLFTPPNLLSLFSRYVDRQRLELLQEKLQWVQSHVSLAHFQFSLKCAVPPSPFNDLKSMGGGKQVHMHNALPLFEYIVLRCLGLWVCAPVGGGISTLSHTLQEEWGRQLA